MAGDRIFCFSCYDAFPGLWILQGFCLLTVELRYSPKATHSVSSYIAVTLALWEEVRECGVPLLSCLANLHISALRCWESFPHPT